MSERAMSERAREPAAAAGRWPPRPRHPPRSRRLPLRRRCPPHSRRLPLRRRRPPQSGLCLPAARVLSALGSRSERGVGLLRAPAGAGPRLRDGAFLLVGRERGGSAARGVRPPRQEQERGRVQDRLSWQQPRPSRKTMWRRRLEGRRALGVICFNCSREGHMKA
jgi:hypothetical protein